MSYDFKVNESYYLTEDYYDLKAGTRIIIRGIVEDDNSKKIIIRRFGDTYYLLYYVYEYNFHLLSKGLDAYKIPEQKESAKPATVIEKKVSVMLALLINKHYEEGLSIFKQEEIKLSSLGNKEAIQLVVDAALDTKDYELLKKLYS